MLLLLFPPAGEQVVLYVYDLSGGAARGMAQALAKQLCESVEFRRKRPRSFSEASAGSARHRRGDHTAHGRRLRARGAGLTPCAPLRKSFFCTQGSACLGASTTSREACSGSRSATLAALPRSRAMPRTCPGHVRDTSLGAFTAHSGLPVHQTLELGRTSLPREVCAGAICDLGQSRPGDADVGRSRTISESLGEPRRTLERLLPRGVRRVLRRGWRGALLSRRVLAAREQLQPLLERVCAVPAGRRHSAAHRRPAKGRALAP